MENRISDDQLNALIDFASEDIKSGERVALDQCRLDAFLELRQLRSDIKFCMKKIAEKSIEIIDLIEQRDTILNAGIKIYDRICDCDSKDDGWLYPAIYVDDFIVLKQAIEKAQKS